MGKMKVRCSRCYVGYIVDGFCGNCGYSVKKPSHNYNAINKNCSSHKMSDDEYAAYLGKLNQKYSKMYLDECKRFRDAKAEGREAVDGYINNIIQSFRRMSKKVLEE